MAGNDNSFERQMIDFYGFEVFKDKLNTMHSRLDKDISSVAIQFILFEIHLKYIGISKSELEREKNKIQIELYAQLERDRNNKP